MHIILCKNSWSEVCQWPTILLTFCLIYRQYTLKDHKWTWVVHHLSLSLSVDTADQTDFLPDTYMSYVLDRIIGKLCHCDLYPEFESHSFYLSSEFFCNLSLKLYISHKDISTYHVYVHGFYVTVTYVLNLAAIFVFLIYNYSIFHGSLIFYRKVDQSNIYLCIAYYWTVEYIFSV